MSIFQLENSVDAQSYFSGGKSTVQAVGRGINQPGGNQQSETQKSGQRNDRLARAHSAYQSNRKNASQAQGWGFTPIQKLKLRLKPVTKNQTPVPENQMPLNLAAKRLADQPKIEYVRNGEQYIIEQAGLPASKFAHQPLYFEEVNLERHGKRTRFFQPVWSGIRFLVNTASMPYKMSQQPPRSQSMSRDPYPAGLPAPWVRERNEVTLKGISGQVLAVTAAILLLP